MENIFDKSTSEWGKYTRLMLRDYHQIRKNYKKKLKLDFSKKDVRFDDKLSLSQLFGSQTIFYKFK